MDVTKLYDKAWIMYVLYKEGLMVNQCTIAKMPNQNLITKIYTNFSPIKNTNEQY